MLFLPLLAPTVVLFARRYALAHPLSPFSDRWYLDALDVLDLSLGLYSGIFLKRTAHAVTLDLGFRYT
jgi:hypothetical protein